MSKIVTLMEKDYSWEDVCDVDRDVSEALNDALPEEVEHAYQAFWNKVGDGGTIKIKIEWHSDEQ